MLRHHKPSTLLCLLVLLLGTKLSLASQAEETKFENLQQSTSSDHQRFLLSTAYHQIPITCSAGQQCPLHIDKMWDRLEIALVLNSLSEVVLYFPPVDHYKTMTFNVQHIQAGGYSPTTQTYIFNNNMAGIVDIIITKGFWQRLVTIEREDAMIIFLKNTEDYVQTTVNLRVVVKSVEDLPSEMQKKSLSGGAIAGIVVGAVIILAVVVGTTFWIIRKKRRAQKQDESEEKANQSSSNINSLSEPRSPHSVQGPMTPPGRDEFEIQKKQREMALSERNKTKAEAVKYSKENANRV